MIDKKVVFLGDSTSMSIGVERKSYSFKMADSNVWSGATEIINCSLPGFTSADITAFFFKNKELWIEKLAAVIIYIGNCDAASSEVKKGKFGHIREWHNKAIELRNLPPKKTKLKNKLLHYEWNNYWDSKIESPENPTDFQYNIERIAKYCSNKKIPLILIKPKANRFFLPGIGKGNFIFYRFFNVHDRISNLLRISDTRFKDALEKHERGDIDAAIKAYKEILLNRSVSEMSDEYYQVAINNYAVAKAESGNTDESIYLLNLLLKEKSVRREIVLYNLAGIYKFCGDRNAYTDLIHQSYESDQSLYRVRRPYLQVIDKVSKKYTNIKVADMEQIIPDELYLDHCHPLPDGQNVLAEAVINLLHDSGIGGNEKAVIKNILFNPELSLGNSQGFHEYFKTFSTLSEEDIANNIRIISETLGSSDYFKIRTSLLELTSAGFIETIEYYLRHPCFPEVGDIIKSPPLYSSDVGRFPEYYLARYVIPFLKAHESIPDLVKRFSENLDLIRPSESFASILPDTSMKSFDLNFSKIDREYEINKLPRILSKVRAQLLEHLAKKNQVFERVKSTIFWYVRESLRFGAHSRYSMLYDRVTLEYMAEALVVAGVLDNYLKLEMSHEIKKLIAILEKVVFIHEKYCLQFSLKNNSTKLLVKYDSELMDVFKELKG